MDPPYAAFAASTGVAMDTPAPRAVLAAGLEQFHRVARGVVEQDFGSAGPRHDVIAKVQMLLTQSEDFRFEIVYIEDDPIPATGLRLAPI